MDKLDKIKESLIESRDELLNRTIKYFGDKITKICTENNVYADDLIGIKIYDMEGKEIENDEVTDLIYAENLFLDEMNSSLQGWRFDNTGFRYIGQEDSHDNKMVDYQMKNIGKKESLNEGFNLYTLKARADIMKDLYVNIEGHGDEVFKVLFVLPKSIHDGTLSVISQETGRDLVISHDEITKSLVGDQYDGHTATTSNFLESVKDHNIYLKNIKK